MASKFSKFVFLQELENLPLSSRYPEKLHELACRHGNILNSDKASLLEFLALSKLESTIPEAIVLERAKYYLQGN